MTIRAPDPLTIYSTCPQSKDVAQADYLRTVVRHAQWSEEAGCAGMLLYTDNGLVDPWHLAHAVVAETDSLWPLVAVQPIYMHPYWVAKQIATLAHLHGRKVALNMLAGGFKNDLLALGDDTPHDDRYVRTTEYTHIVRALLKGERPVSFAGKYYSVSNLSLAPALPGELFPEILISGSSDAGLEAARAIGATAIRYPKPAEQEVGETELAGLACGVRVGIIARESADRAWRVAAERFPATRQGAILHRLAMNASDSVWHRDLSDLEERPAGPDSPYWLGPFKSYKTFCPYLVGTYEDVAAELARYVAKGHRAFILDIAPSAAEFEHINIAFDLAMKQVSHAQAAA